MNEERSMNSYAQIYRDATLDKAGFWLDAATAIDWFRRQKPVSMTAIRRFIAGFLMVR
jgi:hypothetical protein